MIADSKRLYVVSLLAMTAILFTSILVLIPQQSPVQQATLVSLTTRPAPKLDVSPVPAGNQTRLATAQKQAQTSAAATTVSPAPKVVSSPARVNPKPVTSPPAPVLSPSPGLVSNALVSMDLPSGLLCIRGPWGKATHESGSDYTIHTEWPSGRESTTTGAYQYDDPTWGKFLGYARAYLAPPWVQDLKAFLDYNLGPQHRHQLWPHTSYLCGV
jgi:hypothetical protein